MCIVSVCPKEQMLWINARSVVTVMTHTHTGWYFSKRLFPYVSMNTLSTMSVEAKTIVAVVQTFKIMNDKTTARIH